MDDKIHEFEDLHIHASLGAPAYGIHRKNYIANESFSNNYFGWHGLTKYRKYSIVGNAYLEMATSSAPMTLTLWLAQSKATTIAVVILKVRGTDQITGRS